MGALGKDPEDTRGPQDLLPLQHGLALPPSREKSSKTSWRGFVVVGDRHPPGLPGPKEGAGCLVLVVSTTKTSIRGREQAPHKLPPAILACPQPANPPHAEGIAEPHASPSANPFAYVPKPFDGRNRVNKNIGYQARLNDRRIHREILRIRNRRASNADVEMGDADPSPALLLDDGICDDEMDLGSDQSMQSPTHQVGNYSVSNVDKRRLPLARAAGTRRSVAARGQTDRHGTAKRMSDGCQGEGSMALA